VATRFDRIAVTKDPALAEALDRVAPLVGARTPVATLVHDLAIRGSQVIVEERRRRAEQLAWVAQATTTDIPWDVDVLARIDELAWGTPSGTA
jgi:hypothetical protein